MQTTTSSGRARIAQTKDFLNLCKPRVVVLMLITSYVGMILAVPSQSLPTLAVILYGGIGIMLAAGAGGVINQLIDRHIDYIMSRTQNRPLPRQSVSTPQAIIQAIFMSIISLCILWWKVNPNTAILTLATLLGYGFLYSVYLKRATPQNIVIGGLAGAMPPMLGWCAATGQLTGAGWLLVLIIFIWTPPHFWALAIHRKDDYAKAGLPMLPLTHGLAFTRLNILLYTVLLCVCTYLPCFFKLSGSTYAIGVSALNGLFLYKTWQLFYKPCPKLPFAIFRYSIIYLALLFLLLLIDHFIP